MTKMVPICSNMSGFAADCHSSSVVATYPPGSTYPHLGPPKKLAGHRKFIHETGSVSPCNGLESSSANSSASSNPSRQGTQTHRGVDRPKAMPGPRLKFCDFGLLNSINVRRRRRCPKTPEDPQGSEQQFKN
jgi:hypothetical protein